MIRATFWLAQIDSQDPVVTRPGYRNVQRVSAPAIVARRSSNLDVLRTIVTGGAGSSSSSIRISFYLSLVEFHPLRFAGTIAGRVGNLQSVGLPAGKIPPDVRNEFEDVSRIGFADRIEIALRIKAHSFVRLPSYSRSWDTIAGLWVQFIDQTAVSFLGDQK